MPDTTIPAFQCFFNAFVLGAMAVGAAYRGHYGPSFVVASCLAVMFLGAGWLVRREVFWPSLVAWLALVLAFILTMFVRSPDVGIMEGGLFIGPLLMLGVLYLIFGGTGAVVATVQARAAWRRRASGPDK